MMRIVWMLAAVGYVACDTSVVTDDGDGGAGTGGHNVKIETTVEPADCPAEPPGVLSACSELGKMCHYTTGGCVLTYACFERVLDPTNDFECGNGGLVWGPPTQGECDGCAGSADCVPCSEATDFDPCDVIGAHCTGEIGGNCGGVLECTADGWRNFYDYGCCA